MGAVKDLVRLLILVEVAIAVAGPATTVAALSVDYYAMGCPFAEYMVRDVVNKAVMADPTLAAGLLRLHFHDCFVQVCIYMHACFFPRNSKRSGYPVFLMASI